MHRFLLNKPDSSGNAFLIAATSFLRMTRRLKKIGTNSGAKVPMKRLHTFPNPDKILPKTFPFS